MKIIYGVSGEGFGHSSRSKEIISHLKKKGHKVLVLTYGQALGPLKKFKPIKIPGIIIHFNEKNSLSLPKTALNAIESYVNSVPNFFEIKRKIDSFNPDVFITDFEPLTAIISFWYKKPLISIDNQHILTNLNIRIPKKYISSYFVAKTATNLCVSKAKAFIILSFIKQKSNENTFIVSPVLRKEIINLKPSKSDFILVYQTKKDKKLVNNLKSLPYHFVVYGHETPYKRENITYKKISSTFIKDLSKAKAVIASAGFTLISEALYLKKPYFAIPLKGQFEQTLNALFIKKAKLGDYSENPSKKQIQNFLKNLKKYEKNLMNYNLNPKEATNALDNILKNINFISEKG